MTPQHGAYELHAEKARLHARTRPYPRAHARTRARARTHARTYIILIDFPRQKWSRVLASMLRYMHFPASLY